jgi:hypothetical protein
MQRSIASSLAALLVVGQVAGTAIATAQSTTQTATPIKHLVVIFQENVQRIGVSAKVVIVGDIRLFRMAVAA